MREKKPVEPSKSGAAPQQLALRSLSAIDHEAVPGRLDQKTWVIALRRRDAGRGSEKCQVEHRGSLVAPADLTYRGVKPAVPRTPSPSLSLAGRRRTRSPFALRPGWSQGRGQIFRRPTPLFGRDLRR
jgi:hypothetical protein